MSEQKPEGSFVDELIDSSLGQFQWVKSVLLGQFAPERELSAITAEILLNFVPGVVIVSSARDAVAITIRMANHPEKRDDVMEWMYLCACLIVIALPLASAAGGALFAGVGAIVGGVVGSELAAYLKAIILLLMSKSSLSDVVLFFQRFMKGEVITLLMLIKFVESEKILIAFLGATNTKLINICAGLRLRLKPYDCFDDVRVAIAKLTEWEAKFYAVQAAAVKNIPLALAELDVRMAAILAQARPKEVHTVVTGVKAAAPARLPVVAQRVHATPGQALRQPSASQNAQIKTGAAPAGKVSEGPNTKRQATGGIDKITQENAGQVIGAANGPGRVNLINPTDRLDNCTACVSANIANKLEGRAFDDLMTAQQVEAKWGNTGAAMGLSEAQSLAYVERATGTVGVKAPMLAPNAPIGHYSVFGTSIESGRGHIMYGQVLPNGRTYFYDPQIGGRTMTYDYLRTVYKDMRTYYMRPK